MPTPPRTPRTPDTADFTASEEQAQKDPAQDGQRLEAAAWNASAQPLPRQQDPDAQDPDAHRKSKNPLKLYQDFADEVLDRNAELKARLVELEFVEYAQKRALFEMTDAQQRLHAAMQAPAMDRILEQLAAAAFALPAKTEEEARLISELERLGKVRVIGNAVLTDEGKRLLQDWE